MPTRTQLDAALARYSEALSLRANAAKTSADLVRLDHWYRHDLRAAVRKRGQQPREDGARTAASETPWLSKDELSRLMEWKLAVRLFRERRGQTATRDSTRDCFRRATQRGKWRPRLQAMVATNSADDIRAVTARAAANPDPESALKELSTLKAVGPATASAILALWHPDSEPFMSDEGLDYAAALGSGGGGGDDDDTRRKSKRDYTVKAWRAYRDEMLARKEKEGWSSVDDLEKAIWAWAVLQTYGASGEAGQGTAAAGADAVAPKEEGAPEVDAGDTSRKTRKRDAQVEAVASQKKRRKST